MNPNASPFKEPPRPQEWRRGYPLITPSASPPVSRSFSLADRLASRAPTSTTGTATPPPTRRTNRTATPAGSRDSNFDFHLARKASAMRVWDVWSQLEERYTRRIDEDDIIDLRLNSVIKDRGILRGLSQQYDIGTFAEADANDAASEGAGGQTEGEDDVDELDAFAPEADLSVNTFAITPSARELDPEDLEEFLEAERKRKELYGDEDEEETCEFASGRATSSRKEVIEETQKTGEEVAFVESEVEVDVRAERNVRRSKIPERRVLEESDQPADDDSDELNEWDQDESSALYLVESERDVNTQDNIQDNTLTTPEQLQKKSGNRHADLFSPGPTSPDVNTRNDSTINSNTNIDPNHIKLPEKKTKRREDATQKEDSVIDAHAFPELSPSRSPKKKQRAQVEVVIPSRRLVQATRSRSVMDSTPSIAASAKGKAKASLSMLKPRSPSPSPGPSQAYVVEPKINMSVPARDNVSPIDTLLHRKMRDKTPAPGATGDISDDDDVPRIPASAKGKGKALPLRSPSPPPSDKATRTSLRRTSKTKATSQQESVRAPAKNRKRKRVSNESTVTLERGDGVSFSRLASASSSPERNYDGYASLSGEASGEDSDPQPPRPFPKSRSRSRAPSRARSHAPVFPLPFPRDPSSQPASGHDLTTQAHFVLAQAMQHLSYLISTTPAPAAPPPGWAPTNFPPVASYPFPQGPWSPQTPSNHRRSRSRYRSVAPTQSSSSPTRPRSSSAFATPVHSYDPAYSGATLPPSSSPASSPESSSDLDFEKMRPQSARYASPSKDRSPSKGKARGRMVSFKLAEDVSPVRQGRKGKEREKSDEDENENE